MSTVANVIAGAAVVMAAGGIALAATLSEPEPPRIGEPVVINQPAQDPKDTPRAKPSKRPGVEPEPGTQQGGSGGRDEERGGDQDDDRGQDGTIRDDDREIEVVRPAPQPLDDDDADDREDDAGDDADDVDDTDD